MAGSQHMNGAGRTASFFDRYAPDFGAIYGNQDRFPESLLNRVFRRSMRLRFEKTLAGCHPLEGRTVIDVGCGPGHYSVALARLGAAHVVGVDFAPGMLSLAAEQASAAGVADRCEFVQADFLEQPEQQQFDYAVVMGVMDYVADPAAFMAKVLRLTRGRAFFSFPVAGGLLAWQRQLRYRHRCRLFLYSESRLRELLLGLAPAYGEIERIDRDFFMTVAAPPPRPGAPTSGR